MENKQEDHMTTINQFDALVIKEFLEANYVAFARFVGEKDIEETEAELIVDGLTP